MQTQCERSQLNERVCDAAARGAAATLVVNRSLTLLVCCGSLWR